MTEQTEQAEVQIQSGCATCPMRLRAEEKPKSLIARLWRWHTNWCPGWKAYQEELARLGLEAPKP